MKSYKGKTIVVTGGASGVGYALCSRFGREDMNVVVADIEQNALNVAVDRLSSEGITAVGVLTDVSDERSVQNLADSAFELFGSVDILCNNAGVGVKEAARKMWDLTSNDWNWAFSVNVMGVVNGIRAFVPRMLEGNDPGHIVNTSSFNGGCCSLPTTPIYAASKASVTSLSEVLYAQLQLARSLVQVHLLFPGPYIVNTQILASQRNRHDRYKDSSNVEDYVSMEDLKKAAFGANKEFKLTEPSEVADACYQGVLNGEFWIRPYTEEHQTMISARSESMLLNRNPYVPS